MVIVKIEHWPETCPLGQYASLEEALEAAITLEQEYLKWEEAGCPETDSTVKYYEGCDIIAFDTDSQKHYYLPENEWEEVLR